MENPLDIELTEEIKEALQNSDQALAAAKIQEYLEKGKNIPLNIAITGESGSGKSTFVNAFRGIDNKDERSAPTGCVETTLEVTEYPHPNYPNVTLWDLPGVGTMKFPADEYLNHVGFEKFDFFIITSANRFTENDVKLAVEIQKMKKKFYFVRSKIDENLRAAERSQREFNEKNTLAQIRENCIQGLQKQNISSPQVFLISSFDLHLYDFHLLEETLERELPEHKRKALLFAMPNISLEIINKKKMAFQDKIKHCATLSAAVAAVPAPGLSVAVDVALLVGVVTQYVLGFGLDIPSLQRLAETTHVPFQDLIDVIISPLAAKNIQNINVDLIMKLLLQCATTAGLMVAEEGSRFIPVLGIPASMGLSFMTTYKGLNAFLDMLAEDAQRVFKRALGLNTSV
ncbi:interferon-inducible GTPase 5 isoform X1 [Larimichthys crocea]|uniref:interferon-inducible GTPase 5 isoform X1 n=1 Tax=Larimichthys crocea TaxID=215358 RepID=UPI000F5DB945|nr:interferon-inducible GTPase 5 isoform X1 [Larimichthys crocea]XP_027132182.1 interferon-inducible GTPase 5 isoform X1 [Larimichthys crocea]